MGWSSANDVALPVLEVLEEQYENGSVSPRATVAIITSLVQSLQQQDWDTEDEVLDRYADKTDTFSTYVTEAFAACGIERCEEDCEPNLVTDLMEALEKSLEESKARRKQDDA